jgi:vacuolar-type H+-ATPase subunit D/Vma8
MIGMTLMEEYLDNSISLAKIENAFEGLNKRIEEEGNKVPKHIQES